MLLEMAPAISEIFSPYPHATLTTQNLQIQLRFPCSISTYLYYILIYFINIYCKRDLVTLRRCKL
jgi:hypothetical protein